MIMRMRIRKSKHWLNNLAASLAGTTVAVAMSAAAATELPARPTDPLQPGSDVYAFQAQVEQFSVRGRTVDVFLPQGARAVSVIVYGHGQATPLSGYDATFKHLARKGVAVIFPQFDSGFFDQDWARMAKDFVSLTKAALDRYPEVLDSNRIVFSGHSKGAYVGLMAAGLPPADQLVRPRSAVFFAPAGYDAAHLARVPADLPVTIIYGDADTIIRESLNREIFQRLPSQRKQFIKVASYRSTNPQLTADHFFPLNDSFFFGGRKGISPFHYFGAWNWLLGAAWDVEKSANQTNPFLYGAEAAESGVPGLNHSIERSW